MVNVAASAMDCVMTLRRRCSNFPKMLMFLCWAPSEHLGHLGSRSAEGHAYKAAMLRWSWNRRTKQSGFTTRPGLNSFETQQPAGGLHKCETQNPRDRGWKAFFMPSVRIFNDERDSMSTRKASNLKLLSGTQRPDRVAPTSSAFTPIDAVPDVPDWLAANPRATAEFARLAALLVQFRLLHAGNVALLWQLAALHSTLVRLQGDEGPGPTAAQLAEHRRLLAALGLTPNMAQPAQSSGAQQNRFLRIRDMAK